MTKVGLNSIRCYGLWPGIKAHKAVNGPCFNLFHLFFISDWSLFAERLSNRLHVTPMSVSSSDHHANVRKPELEALESLFLQHIEGLRLFVLVAVFTLRIPPEKRFSPSVISIVGTRRLELAGKFQHKPWAFLWDQDQPCSWEFKHPNNPNNFQN